VKESQVVDRSTARAAWVEELTSILLQQELLCKRMVELSSRERVSVLEGQMEDLERSIREKGTLVEEMAGHEQARAGTAGRLANELGLPGDASLADIAHHVDNESAASLMEIRCRLSFLAGRLKDSNESNLRLMRKSLASVKDSLRQLRGSVLGPELYTCAGRPAMTRAGVSSLALDRNV
jgi:flagellar biosynthesis/type III secretory pathway chaperone